MVSSALVVLIVVLTWLTEILNTLRVYLRLIQNTYNKNSFKPVVLSLFDSKALHCPTEYSKTSGISAVIMKGLLFFLKGVLIYYFKIMILYVF